MAEAAKTKRDFNPNLDSDRAAARSKAAGKKTKKDSIAGKKFSEEPIQLARSYPFGAWRVNGWKFVWKVTLFPRYPVL